MSAEEDTKVAEQLLSSVFFHWNALSGAWVRFGQDRHLVQLLVFYFSDAIMMWRRVTETYADSGKLGALSAALSTSNSQPNEHIGQGVPWWIWLLGGILLSKLLN
jgi:hypothetical protein